MILQHLKHSVAATSPPEAVTMPPAVVAAVTTPPAAVTTPPAAVTVTWPILSSTPDEPCCSYGDDVVSLASTLQYGEVEDHDYQAAVGLALDTSEQDLSELWESMSSCPASPSPSTSGTPVTPSHLAHCTRLFTADNSPSSFYHPPPTTSAYSYQPQQVLPTAPQPQQQMPMQTPPQPQQMAFQMQTPPQPQQMAFQIQPHPPPTTSAYSFQPQQVLPTAPQLWGVIRVKIGCFRIGYTL